MHSRKIEDYKKKLKLSKFQKEILIGLMLGDGHLETQNNGRTYRLKVEQALAKKCYVDWLYEVFKNFALTPPKKRKVISKGRTSWNICFSTLSCGCFRFHAHQFYVDGIKIVPRNIKKFLSPLAIAVWFADDGSSKSKNHRAKIINTQGFSKKETQILIDALDNLGIKSKPRKQKEGWQIYLLSETISNFSSLIGSRIPKCMKYKLD